MEKSIIYFERKGASNTNRTIEAARKRAEELTIKDIIVASSHGGTALKVAEAFQNMNVNIVAVTISESFKEEGWVMTEEERKKLTAKGIKTLTCLHSLGDNVSSAFTEKKGGTSAEEVVRETLYRFSQGMKVCVEIVMMAADAGFIDVDMEAIAIAGTASGADTAIVVKPSYPRKLQNLEIREIIAKPRIP